MIEFPELVDRIYEAAALPDLWPDVLADIGRFGGGEDAMIFTVVDGTQSYVGSPRINAQMPDFISGGWVPRSERPQRILGRRHHGFITDLDVFSMEEIARDPVYQDWLIPRGSGLIWPAPRSCRRG